MVVALDARRKTADARTLGESQRGGRTGGSARLVPANVTSRLASLRRLAVRPRNVGQARDGRDLVDRGSRFPSCKINQILASNALDRHAWSVPRLAHRRNSRGLRTTMNVLHSLQCCEAGDDVGAGAQVFSAR